MTKQYFGSRIDISILASALTLLSAEARVPFVTLTADQKKQYIYRQGVMTERSKKTNEALKMAGESNPSSFYCLS